MAEKNVPGRDIGSSGGGIPGARSRDGASLRRMDQSTGVDPGAPIGQRASLQRSPFGAGEVAAGAQQVDGVNTQDVQFGTQRIADEPVRQPGKVQPVRESTTVQPVEVTDTAEAAMQLTDPGEVGKGNERVGVLPAHDSESGEESLAHLVKRVGGNSDLENSKVIFLGETHDDRFHEKAIGDFLAENARPGDIILTEAACKDDSAAACLMQYEEIYGDAPDGVIVKGWEDRELYARAEAINRELVPIGSRRNIAELIDDPDAAEWRQRTTEKEAELEGHILLIRGADLRGTIREEERQDGVGRIFIIAGSRHRSADQAFQAFLEERPYIAYDVETTEEMKRLVAAEKEEGIKRDSKIDLVVEAGMADFFEEVIHDPRLRKAQLTITRTEGDGMDHENEEGGLVHIPEGYTHVVIQAGDLVSKGAFIEIAKRVTRERAAEGHAGQEELPVSETQATDVHPGEGLLEPIIMKSEGVEMPEGGWVPDTRKSFPNAPRWSENDPEEARYNAFKAELQRETEAQIPVMAQTIAEFFGIPQEYISDILPEVHINNVIAGLLGNPGYDPENNEIGHTVKYVFPLFLGDVQDIRQTLYLPALGHEVGHFVQMAALHQGIKEDFPTSYRELDHMGFEFFAGIAQRLIAEKMQINLPKEERETYRASDPHIGHVIADEIYEQVKAMNVEERRELAFDHGAIMQLIGQEEVEARQQAIAREREEEIEERRRR